MNDPMDENNLLNDRDMIKDGQGKKQRPNTSKAAALVILFGVCLYLAYSTLFTEKQQPVEVQKEGIIKQTELFRPAPPKPVSLEPTIEKNNVLLPKVELPTPPKKQPILMIHS